MICQFHRPSHDYQLRRGGARREAAGEANEILEFYDRYAAAQFLRALAINPAVTHELRLFLSEQAHFGDVLRLPDDQVLDYVARGLVAGWFEMDRRPVLYVSAPSTLKEEKDKEEPPLVAMVPPEEVTWIQIEALDENDRPLVDEPYRLEPPDGSEPIEGKLDAKGRARHEKIVPGNYRVIFPRREEAWWKPPPKEKIEVEVPKEEIVQAALPVVNWIDMELVDEYGYPVPGEPYRIESLEGAVVFAGELDELGQARYSGLEGDECYVVFPWRDAAYWEPANEQKLEPMAEKGGS